MRLTLAGLLLVTASSATAQTALQLRWQLEEDVFRAKRPRARPSRSRTGTRRPLPAPRLGALLQRAAPAAPGQRRGPASRIERGDGRPAAARARPGVRAACAPGQSVEIEYLTALLTNISFAPVGAYVVFDDAPGQRPRRYGLRGRALRARRRRARGATRAWSRPSSSTRSTP